MTDILVFSCAHADPEVDNGRFDLLGNYIYDTKPDLVVDLGDGADMRSLNSYDTSYPKVVVTQSYQEDIEVYNDSQERLRWKFKLNKRKRPYWVGLEGNHEHRIKSYCPRPSTRGRKVRAFLQPSSNGQVVRRVPRVRTFRPAIATYFGVDFAHYFGGGNRGTAIAGTHPAHTIINNRHRSSVCGHSHKRSVYFKDAPGSIGLVVGCFKGKAEGWAGQANNDWWHGVVHLKNVEDGRFEPQFISLKILQQEYGA